MAIIIAMSGLFISVYQVYLSRKQSIASNMAYINLTERGMAPHPVKNVYAFKFRLENSGRTPAIQVSATLSSLIKGQKKEEKILGEVNILGPNAKGDYSTDYPESLVDQLVDQQENRLILIYKYIDYIKREHTTVNEFIVKNTSTGKQFVLCKQFYQK